MKEQKSTRILFVINPKSGTRQKTDFESVISRVSRTEEFIYEIYKTTGTNDREAIHHRIAAFQPDLVIPVGGDGTINIVAAELAGSAIKMGMIPAGSANGLAFNLQIPLHFEDALYKNLHGNFTPFDVIQINESHYCLHLSDVGINARIVKRFEQEGNKGFLGYGKQLFKELFSSNSSFSCTIKIQEHIKKTKAEMVVIANAHSYGTGVQINPNGKWGDGKFEIVVIKPYPWWFFFTFLYAGFTGKLNKMQYVKDFTATEAEIVFDKEQDLQIDGEIMDPVKQIKLKIIPAALHVISVEERN
ncbi:MAG TPA: diacylglycerol kinase family protein [Draconibacterium sp.]|nr:diacylglycerol kinase family protein [Draconibacterium sp.]